MKINNFFKIIIAIIITESAGIVGSFFTIPTIQSGWYAQLARPKLAPPNWVFGPVWTLLFWLMGIALFIIWFYYDRAVKKAKNEPAPERTEKVKKIKLALVIFAVQLVLNIFWSVIFFGLKSPGAAFAEIILLWIAILATIVSFYRIAKLAAWTLAPYIVWVTFAAYLNFMIWVLN